MLLTVLLFPMQVLLATSATARPPGKIRYDHVGILVEVVRGNELKMKSKTGKLFPVYRVRRGADIKRDGKPSSLMNLKTGDQLRVTIEEEKGGRNREIIRIEARGPRQEGSRNNRARSRRSEPPVVPQ
jgi:hypothetical protein